MTTAAGILTVRKEVVVGDLTQQFNFTVRNQPGTTAFLQEFLLAHTDEQILPVQAGYYDVSEVLPRLWRTQGITVTGDLDNGSIIDVRNSRVVVDVDVDEIIRVVFLNEQEVGSRLSKRSMAPTLVSVLIFWLHPIRVVTRRFNSMVERPISSRFRVPPVTRSSNPVATRYGNCSRSTVSPWIKA
ncbi:MAG: hypothetical protein R3B96_02350 [Pirellulaceae bacterium]